MSDELVASLKSQITQLKQENSNLLTETIKRKQANQELRKQVATLTASTTTLTAERDDFKVKAQTNPNELAEELAKTKGDLRALKHRDGIKELAYSDEVGLNKAVPIDRALKLMDYVPETEEFDPKAARAKLIALKQSDPYLFQPGGDATQDGQTQQGVNPPGSDIAALNPAVQAMVGALGRGSGQPTQGVSRLPSQGQLQDPRGARQWADDTKIANGRR